MITRNHSNLRRIRDVESHLILKHEYIYIHVLTVCAIFLKNDGCIALDYVGSGHTIFALDTFASNITTV